MIQPEGRQGQAPGAWLVVEGASSQGRGDERAYPLNPSEKRTLSIGRSLSCDVVLNDHRSSRHHADLRWTGQGWEVVDLNSTNGTYVNGEPIHPSSPLRPGMRVTIGDTTMTLREGAQPASRAPGPIPTLDAAEPRAPGGPARSHAAAGPAFWIVQAILTVAVVCLAAGSLLPWIEVTGGVRGDTAPLLQKGFEIWGALTGTDPSRTASYMVDGVMAHGRLTLALAIVSSAALVTEMFIYRRSVVPAVVYLVTGLMVVAAMGFDAVNYVQNYEQLQDLDLLFGYQMGDLTGVLGQIVEVEATIQVGIYLVVVGLALLFIGGVARVLLAVLGRERILPV